MTTRRRGVTLIDCLALLAVAAVMIPVAMTAVQQEWERANRVRCLHNLSLIAQSMHQYAIDDDPAGFGAFPRTSADFVDAKPRFGTPYIDDESLDAKSDVDPFLTARAAGDDPSKKELLKYVPRANDITAAMWLLIRYGETTPATFVCPSTRREPFAFPDGADEMSYTN